MKALSEWQLQRVRDALRVYHHYTRGRDDCYFTWKDVREAIAEFTGYEIGVDAKSGGESLRRFVEGQEDKRRPKGKVYPAPKPDALSAIVEFVTHEELSLLTEEELEEFKPPWQAPLRMLEYLSHQCDLQASVNGLKLRGEYLTFQVTPDGVSITVLTMPFVHFADIPVPIQITETVHHYSTNDINEAYEWHTQGHKDKRASQALFGGWAIITPEDTLMIFMKDSVNGRNHSYVSVNDIHSLTRNRTQKGEAALYLVRHDFALELDDDSGDGADNRKSILNEMDNNVRWFNLVDEMELSK